MNPVIKENTIEAIEATINNTPVSSSPPHVNANAKKAKGSHNKDRARDRKPYPVDLSFFKGLLFACNTSVLSSESFCVCLISVLSVLSVFFGTGKEAFIVVVIKRK